MSRLTVVFILLPLLLPLSVHAKDPAVLFVFDGSGSMWGQIDGTPKILLAKEAMSGLLADFPTGTDLGLVAYGHNREADCNDIELLAPLGTGRDEVITAVASINPKGKTPLTQSILFAAEQLKSRDSPTAIIVVSDGIESCGADPCAAASAIVASGVDLKIHVIGFDVSSEDAEKLRCIADNGGGKFYAAGSASELVKSFSEVKKEVVRIEATPTEKVPQARVIFQDHFDEEFLSDDWELINQNEDSLIVEDGYLQILTDGAQGSMFNPVNFVVLKRELSGQYEIILKMKYSRTDSSKDWTQNQPAGLMLYKDDENGIVLAASNASGYPYWGNDGIHYSRIRANEWQADFTHNLPDAIREREISLRIQRIKRKFIASFLNSEGEWQILGEYTELRPEYRVGIFTARGGGSHEDLQQFDSFIFKAIE